MKIKFLFIIGFIFYSYSSFSTDNKDDTLNFSFSPIKSVNVSPSTFFYLSFSNAFDFFDADEKGRELLSKIDPSRVKQEINNLKSLSQALFLKMEAVFCDNPVLKTSFIETQNLSQINAIDSLYKSIMSTGPYENISLLPLSEDHLIEFKEKNKIFNKIFDLDSVDANIENALKELLSSSLLPHETIIVLSAKAVRFLLFFKLADLFYIENATNYTNHTHYMTYDYFKSSLNNVLYSADFYEKYRNLMNKYEEGKKELLTAKVDKEIVEERKKKIDSVRGNMSEKEWLRKGNLFFGMSAEANPHPLYHERRNLMERFFELLGDIESKHEVEHKCPSYSQHFKAKPISIKALKKLLGELTYSKRFIKDLGLFREAYSEIINKFYSVYCK